MALKTPLLVMGFNRPDLTADLMAAVRRAQPERLFLAAHGPRPNRPDEDALCNEVRRLMVDIDWPCSLEWRFPPDNHGRRDAVSGALAWFFGRVDEGIVLEDSCLPSPDFFRFCTEMLERYRNDRRIMAICGSNYLDEVSLSPDTYYFSYYADTAGWATWRRAWATYDPAMGRWPAFKARGGIEAISGGRARCEAYWRRAFEDAYAGRIDDWDYPWMFNVMDQGGLACYPTRNLIANVGSIAHATCVPEKGSLGTVTRQRRLMAFPLRHPESMVRSAAVDWVIESVRQDPA